MLVVGPWSARVHRRYVAVCLVLVVGLLVVTLAALTLGANTVSLPRALAAMMGRRNPKAGSLSPCSRNSAG